MLLTVKDVWTYLILPQLSPIDLVYFGLASKRCLTLTESFQHIIEKWKQLTFSMTAEHCLIKAALAGDSSLVQLFIDKGAKNLNTALGSAALGGHEDLIKLFVSKGAASFKSSLFYLTVPI